jgi:hypothetical protein
LSGLAKSKLSTLTVAAIALAVIPAAAAPPKIKPLNAPPIAAGNIPALELHQIHNMGGPQTIILSKGGIRYEHINSGVILFSKKPFTHVSVYNPNKKMHIVLEMNQAVKNMKGLAFVLETTGEFTDVPFSAPKTVPFSGVDALLYTKKTKNKSWCNYYVLKEKSWPDSLINMVVAHSAMTYKMGIPLRLRQFVAGADAIAIGGERNEGETMTIFDTTQVKHLSVADSTFSVPQYSKFTTNNRAVMGNAVGFGSYKDMINSPDFFFQSSTKKLGGPADAKLNELQDPKKRSKLMEQMMLGPDNK